MRVVWTETAQDHLDAIYAYISQDSPRYALRMVDRLTRRSRQIADSPLSGRRVPEYDMDQIREIFEGPYRILYHITSDQIDILAILHGARNLLSSEGRKN
jgi:addiction module RelE/StbE family toxin